MSGVASSPARIAAPRRLLGGGGGSRSFWGLGLWVLGLGFGVSGLGFRVEGCAGFRVWGLGSRVLRRVYGFRWLRV